MAKGRDNGTTILLGLEHCKVGKVCEVEGMMIVRTEISGEQKCSILTESRLFIDK